MARENFWERPGGNLRKTGINYSCIVLDMTVAE